MMPPTRVSELLSGVKAELPILLGVAPFGMIYGALAMAAGLPATMAQAMSSVVFAGSAQFIAVQLISQGAPALVLLMTTFVVNIRHMLYSASVAPYLRPLRPAWKWLLAYLLTDEAYAVAILHYQQTATGDHRRVGHVARGTTAGENAPLTPQSWEEPGSPRNRGAGGAVFKTDAETASQDPQRPPRLRGEMSMPDRRHWYLLGAGLALWTTWQLSTAVGIFLGARVPPSWSLDFALPLTFIALLAPILKDRPTVAAALAAGVVAVIGAGWPYKLGLVVAALAGIAAGAWVEKQAGNGATERLR